MLDPAAIICVTPHMKRVSRLRTPPTAKISSEIEVPDEYVLGPAMQRLNERQRHFVTAMIEYGGTSYSRAARAAGYSEATVLHHAHKMAHDESIQAAIKEEAVRRLNTGALMAVKTVLIIMEDPTTEKKDRLKAAEMIMNRTGMHATSEHKVAVTHKDETPSELVKRIESMARGLGLDPKKLLGNAAIDAEFEEVVEEDSLDDIL